MKTLVRARWLTVSLFVGMSHAAGTGQITGSVVDPSGKPLASANVLVLVRPPASASEAFVSFNAAATTGTDGTFSVTGVPAGRFAVCASVSNQPLLPSCGWQSEQIVAVATGQSLNLQPIQLKAGVDLYVRVNDPNGTRLSTEGKVAGASMLLLAGLSTGGVPIPIPMTDFNNKGYDYHLTVPPSTALNLTVFSSFYSLTDANGTAIDPQKGLVQPITIAASAGQYQVTINVQ